MSRRPRVFRAARRTATRFLTLLMCAIVPAASVAQAQDAAKEDSASELKALRQELQAVRKDISEIRRSLKTLEKKLIQQDRPSEFSQVTVRIQTPLGQPLAGFAFEMESARHEGRRIVARGESDGEGLGLSRALPYGDYDLTITHPSGWRTDFERLTVELGRPLEKVVSAPDPSQRASVQFRSSIAPECFKGLRFGKREHHRSGRRGYTVFHSPEPGMESKLFHMPFETFPTVGDGITAVGVECDIRLKQELPQPDGDRQTWNWSPPDDRSFPVAILALRDSVRMVADFDGSSVSPERSAAYFRRKDPSKEEDDLKEYEVGFSELQFSNAARGEATLEVVPGTLVVSVERLLGKADDAVLEVLGQQHGRRREIWLEASLGASSEWIPRVLDLDGWERGESISFLARKTQVIPPEERAVVTIESP